MRTARGAHFLLAGKKSMLYNKKKTKKEDDPMKMRNKISLLLLLAALFAALTLAASATDVSTASQLCSALWGGTKVGTDADEKGDFSWSVQSPVTIRLTADITYTYDSSNKGTASPFRSASRLQNVYVAPGSEIDLNGHTLTLNNIKFYYAEGSAVCADQSAPLFHGGSVRAGMGNNTNTTWALNAQQGIFGGCLTDFYTTSVNSFEGSALAQFYVPNGVTMHLSHYSSSIHRGNYTAVNYARALVLAPDAALDGENDFHALNPSALVAAEAASEKDLSVERLATPYLDRVVLIADITAPTLELVLPENVTLDYNGHTLLCASLTGKTMNTAAPASEEAAVLSEDTMSVRVTVPAEAAYVWVTAYRENGRMAGSALASSDSQIDLSRWAGCRICVIEADAACRPVSAARTLTENLPHVSQGLAFRSSGYNTCTLVGMGSCTDTELVVPTCDPDGRKVTAVAGGAFAGEKLTSAVLPVYVSSVTDGTFPEETEVTMLGFLALREPAWEPLEATIPVDKETAVKALIATSMAYFNKKTYMQYDAHPFTIEGKWPGPMRCNHYAAPEFAAADQNHFSQCTDFVCDVYFQTFGYEFMQGYKAPGSAIMAERNVPEVVYFRDDVTSQNVNAVVAEYRSLLEPGDLVVTYGDSGHAMLYLGDCRGDGNNYLIHCWGASFDNDTGVDAYESIGSIRLQKENELIFGPKVGSSANWNLYSASHYSRFVSIIRPFADPDFVFAITPATASRLQYEQIDIDYSADRTQYNDVIPGEDVTMTVTVKNNSKKAYSALPVRIVLPEGVTLKSGSLTASLNIAAGKTAKVQVTVTVTAKAGEEITFPSCYVADIPTRSITLQVGEAHLTEEQKGKIYKVSVGYIPDSLKAAGKTGLKFAGDFYREVLGVELGLPDTVNEYLEACYEYAPPATGLYDFLQMLTPKTPDAGYEKIAAMTVREHIGGRYVTLGLDVTNRAMEIRDSFYQPGDIILTMSGSSQTRLRSVNDADVRIYLGNGKVLQQNAGSAATVESFGSTVAYSFKDNLFVVFRPTLVWSAVSGS